MKKPRPDPRPAKQDAKSHCAPQFMSFCRVKVLIMRTACMRSAPDGVAGTKAACRTEDGRADSTFFTTKVDFLQVFFKGKVMHTKKVAQCGINVTAGPNKAAEASNFSLRNVEKKLPFPSAGPKIFCIRAVRMGLAVPQKKLPATEKVAQESFFGAGKVDKYNSLILNEILCR